MSVTFGEQLVVRTRSWTLLKSELDKYNARLQYEDEGETYALWFRDNGCIFITTIYKNAVPYAVIESGYTQQQNDADKAEFLAAYAPSANRPNDPHQKDRAALVAIAGTEGSEAIYATHNFCDKTTWYGDSTRVTAHTMTDSGDGLTWTSGTVNWIDMVHGKVLDEDGLRQDAAHGYLVVVKVNGVEKTVREAYETSGGDYTVNYANGTITFFVSQAGNTVTADFSHENGSTWYLRPASGYALDILEAEAQFSIDIDMQDTIRFGVWGWVQVFAPQLWDGYDPPGPLPTNTHIELQSQRYMRRNQMIDEARGAYPLIKASGGASRGSQQDVIGMPFQYEALRRLWNQYGMELRISLEHGHVFGGEHATATFYMRSRNEDTL